MVRSNAVCSLLLVQFIGCALALNAADRNKALWEAANKGEDKKVDQLLSEGADANVFRNDWSPLMLASVLGRTHMAESLLKAGAKPDTADKSRWTALHFAARFNHPDVAKILAVAGAPIDAAEKDGVTPLMLAAVSGNPQTVKILLDAGANIEAAEATNGNRPLMLAARSGSAETVRLLVARGASVNAVSQRGETPLIFAAADGSPEATRALLELGADPAMTAASGATALSLAEGKQKPATTQVLKDFARGGVEAIRRGPPGERPLLRISGTDVWLETPKRAYTKLDDLRTEQTARVQVTSSRENDKRAMHEDTLYAIVERYLLPDARKLDADAVLIEEATTAKQTVTESSPSFAQAVVLGTLAALANRPIVVTPRQQVFVDTTHTVRAIAIKYEPEMADIVAAASKDPSLQAEVMFWNSIRDAKTAEPLQLYLDKYPAGHFAELARSRLKQSKEREERARQNAVLVVYRVPGAPGKPSFFVDQLEVARLLGGCYIKLSLPPGAKNIVTDKRKRAGTLFTFAGGETYYMRSNWGFRRDEHVDLVNASKARPEVSSMKQLESKWIVDRSLFHADQSNP